MATVQNLNYQKDLQNRIFSREDSSVQRRVADLKAAGLSPVLAAGQGASAGPVVSTKAPEFDAGDFTNALQAMQMQNTQKQMDLADADITKHMLNRHILSSKSKGISGYCKTENRERLFE